MVTVQSVLRPFVRLALWHTFGDVLEYHNNLIRCIFLHKKRYNVGEYPTRPFPFRRIHAHNHAVYGLSGLESR